LGTLQRRADDDLPWVADEPAIGGALFLDTSVYLDVLQGRSPVEVDTLLTYRLCHHSAVCLCELTHAFGRLDPKHVSTKTVLQIIQATIDDIPEHRLHAPDAAIWGQAGVLAGLLSRLSNLPKGEGHERRFVNDALIFLQARQLGASVLTGNIRDFDYLCQIIPTGRIILYRPSAASRSK
jgi:predicted nucleic acid-binding protein